jgi:hypothetical protein
MSNLTASTRAWSWAAIAKANPAASIEEINIRFVALFYGEALANEVQADLERRKHLAAI